MSTTNNPVVLNAIAALNDERQKAAEREAGIIVGYIMSEQATIARLEKEIQLHREELDKVAHDVISAETVMGHAAPTNPNVSEVTIGKVIAKLNEDKQKGVEVVAQRLGSAISEKQASIRATEKRIVELREKLAKLQPEVVTPATVLQS